MTRAYDPCMTLVGVNEYSVIVSKFRFELTPTLLSELEDIQNRSECFIPVFFIYERK